MYKINTLKNISFLSINVLISSEMFKRIIGGE